MVNTMIEAFEACVERRGRAEAGIACWNGWRAGSKAGGVSTAAFGDDVLCVVSSFEALCEKVELAEAWSWVFKAVLGINGTTKTTWGALEWDEATGKRILCH